MPIRAVSLHRDETCAIGGAVGQDRRMKMHIPCDDHRTIRATSRISFVCSNVRCRTISDKPLAIYSILAWRQAEAVSFEPRLRQRISAGCTRSSVAALRNNRSGARLRADVGGDGLPGRDRAPGERAQARPLAGTGGVPDRAAPPVLWRVGPPPTAGARIIGSMASRVSNCTTSIAPWRGWARNSPRTSRTARRRLRRAA